MSAKPLPIALTMGEPAGIGGELSIKTWHRHRRQLPPFYLLDDPGRIEALSEAMGTPLTAAVPRSCAQAHISMGDIDLLLRRVGAAAAAQGR